MKIFSTMILGWLLVIGNLGFTGEKDLIGSDLEFCMKTPEFSAVNDVPLDFPVVQQVKAIWIKDSLWKGKETRLFAWHGVPQHAEEKISGVTLLHGSGGTAFSGWVEHWNRRGYAAIAIDQTGCYPTGSGWGKGCKHILHKEGGPSAIEEVGLNVSRNLAYMHFKSNGNRIDHAYFLYTSEIGDNRNQKWT